MPSHHSTPDFAAKRRGRRGGDGRPASPCGRQRLRCGYLVAGRVDYRQAEVGDHRKVVGDPARVVVVWDLDTDHVVDQLGGDQDVVDRAKLARAIDPVYESFEGWMTDTTRMSRWEELPGAARAYLDALGDIIGTEVALVGVGPERNQTLVRPDSWLERQLRMRNLPAG